LIKCISIAKKVKISLYYYELFSQAYPTVLVKCIPISVFLQTFLFFLGGHHVPGLDLFKRNTDFERKDFKDKARIKSRKLAQATLIEVREAMNLVL
jgi:hypothetical protein